MDFFLSCVVFPANEISEKSLAVKCRAGIVPSLCMMGAMDYKKISDMLTLGAPVLVVCSCVRLLTYYHHWNIPILDYLSLSELLMLFIQPILMIAALALSAIVVYGADMFSGTWKANVAKSKYSPGPPPKSAMQKIDSVEGGFKLVADGENSEGKKNHNDYTVKFDGKDYPEHPMLDGKPNPNAADTISIKKTDDFTYEATTKKGGKVLTTTKNVVSKDGKTRTSTTTGTNAQGQNVNNVVMWEKQ